MLGVIPSIQKLIIDTGIEPLTLVFICNSIAACGAFLYLLGKRIQIRIKRFQALEMGLIGILGLFLTDFLLNVAYTMIPVGIVTMIYFIYPSIVCLVTSVFFHERLSGYKISAMVCSLIGLLCLAGGETSANATGILIAFITSMTYAFYIVANDKMKIRELPVMVRSLYTNFFVGITSGILLLVRKCSLREPIAFPNGTIDWILCILVGMMLLAAVTCLENGIVMVGADTASFTNMIEPITSLFVSMFVFHYLPTASMTVGCVLIIMALLFIVRNQEGK